MADPFSIVAVITGVITLADEVFTRTFVYVKAVKHGEEERAKPNLQISTLFGILSRLRLLSCAMEGKEGQKSYEPVLQTHQLDDCRNTLEKIKFKIEAYEGARHAIGRPAVRSTLRPLRWPFTSSEVQRLLSDIEIHKANLSLALAADEYSKLLELLSTQGKICEAMQGIQSKLDHSALTNRRRQIEDSFGSIHPGKSHDMSRKLRHTSTGLWLTKGKEFQKWLSDKTAKNIWCYGIPGSGKTVLASTVIEEVQQRRCESVSTAYFYCDHKDVETQDPANILGSLAKQLVGQSDACFEKAAAFHEVHHSDKQVSTSYSPNDLRDLILEMSSIFDRTMIVVDGLDECEKNIMIVVKLLSSLGKSDISRVQTLFLSRDEIEIRETLADYTPLSIAASKHDLRLYVTLELATRMEKLHNKNKPLVDLITDRLVNGANGMFRWAACQIDYLCELPNDRERRVALDTLPPDLKSTYERILSRVDERTIPTQLLVQRTLRWLFVARRELTISALREALAMKNGTQRLDRDDVPDEFDLLRACSSLVRKSTSGQKLELAHFTVKEFLRGIDCESRFSPYRVDLEQSKKELAKACLTHLTMQDFDSRASWSREAQLKRYQDYAFRRYAVKNWHYHAKGHLGDPDLLALTKKLFDPSKPGNFTTWTQDHQYIFKFHEDEPTPDESSSMKAFQSVYSTIVTDTPLHYASALALPEVCKWLLNCGCNVNLISRFGSPLNHALGGPNSLLDEHVVCCMRDNEQLLKVMDILLEAGADPNSKSRDGLPPLYYAFEDLDVISRLLREGARYIIEDMPSSMKDPGQDAEAFLIGIGKKDLLEFQIRCERVANDLIESVIKAHSIS